MEAPQGVQSTGTNRPSDLNTPTPHQKRGGETCSRSLCGSRDTTGNHPPRTRVPNTRFGGHSGGETPGPIPNPEVKPSSADGTAPGTVWESRTPPDTNIDTKEEMNHPKGRNISSFAFPGAFLKDLNSGDRRPTRAPGGRGRAPPDFRRTAPPERPRQ